MVGFLKRLALLVLYIPFFAFTPFWMILVAPAWWLLTGRSFRETVELYMDFVMIDFPEWAGIDTRFNYY